MPAKSVAQRRFMGMVRATQKGEMKDPSPEVRDAAKDMSAKAVREFAKTKEKNLPMKKEEVEHLEEMPYQVYGSPDGKKEKKIGKPVKSKKYADARAAELADTHKKTGGKYRSEYTEATYPSDFRNADGSRRAVAKKKTGRPNAQGPESGKKEINEGGDYWHPDPEQDRKLGGPGANQRAREDRAAASKPAAKKEDPKKLRKGESYMDYAKRQKGYTPPKKKEGLRDKLKRKLGLKEDAPTMSAGDGGFSGSADANGPTAGFDPPMTGLTTKKPRKFCTKKKYQSKRC